MKFKFTLLLQLLSLLCAWQLQAQTAAPKYANEYLQMGAGARAMALANSYSALATGATAGYWNPAGLLAQQSTYELSFMHNSSFGGVGNYDFIGFSGRIDSLSSFGVTALRLGFDDIPDTRFLFDSDGRLNYNNVRSFSAADYGFLFSYARHIAKLPNLRVGATLKLLHRRAGEFADAWGYGLDAGVQWQKGKWQLGVNARDVLGTYTLWSVNTSSLEEVFSQTGNEIPDNSMEVALPRITADIARTFSGTDVSSGELFSNISLLLTGGIEVTTDGKRNTLIKTGLVSIDPRFGAEIGYKNSVFIRSGLGQFQQVSNFDSSGLRPQSSFGLGIKYGDLNVDYALANNAFASQGVNSHIFSLSFSFGNSNSTK